MQLFSKVYFFIQTLKIKKKYIKLTLQIVYNTLNHPFFHSKERMINLARGRECFVGLYLQYYYSSLCVQGVPGSAGGGREQAPQPDGVPQGSEQGKTITDHVVRGPFKRKCHEISDFLKASWSEVIWAPDYHKNLSGKNV